MILRITSKLKMRFVAAHVCYSGLRKWLYRTKTARRPTFVRVSLVIIHVLSHTLHDSLVLYTLNYYFLLFENFPHYDLTVILFMKL
jgi:hypothetical protein